MKVNEANKRITAQRRKEMVKIKAIVNRKFQNYKIGMKSKIKR